MRVATRTDEQNTRNFRTITYCLKCRGKEKFLRPKNKTSQLFEAYLYRNRKQIRADNIKANTLVVKQKKSFKGL